MLLTETEMAAAAAATAPPGVVTLGGRTFVVPAPTVEDYGVLMREMRRQVQANARDPLEVVNERISAAEKAGRPYSQTVVKMLVESALAGSTSKDAKAEPSQEQCLSQLQTLAGMRWWAWWLLRKADPEISPAWVAEQVADDSAAFRLSAELGKLSEHKSISPK